MGFFETLMRWNLKQFGMDDLGSSSCVLVLLIAEKKEGGTPDGYICK